MVNKDQKKTGTKIAIIIILFLVAAGSLVIGYYYFCGPPKKVGPEKNKSQKTESNRKKDNESQQLNNEDVIVYKNNRFGFKINYLKTWQAEEAQNGDGITLTLPSAKNLLIKVYGYNNVMQDPLSKIATDQESWKRGEHSDFAVIESDNAKVDSLSAVEAIWEYSAGPGESPLQGKITHQSFTLLKGEVVYNLEMQVSKELFEQYKITFREIVDSFKVN